MLKSWLFVALMLLVPPNTAAAHHVLGRPAYSLNEDSNTPPSMQGEALIGEYIVTYMIFPAFPRPGEPGRIHLYATTIDGGEPFAGKVSFSLRADSWRSTGDSVALGVQPADDHVYRQGFQVVQAGNYMVTARFEVDGEPYVLDFPMRVGAPPLFGPLEIAAGLLLALLVFISLIQRRRAMTGKIRSASQ
jgi:hypothetical protein